MSAKPNPTHAHPAFCVESDELLGLGVNLAQLQDFLVLHMSIISQTLKLTTILQCNGNKSDTEWTPKKIKESDKGGEDVEPMKEIFDRIGYASA